MFLQYGILFLFSLSALPVIYGKQLSMKVVESPTNIGLNQPFQSAYNQNTIKLRVPPANFTGPAHLAYLHGRCYTKTTEDYRYDFCPFDNITQHELTLRWNSYRGVLGVWRDWLIENNTFALMNMEDGDGCGIGKFRSTQVKLICGNRTEILGIDEPSTCHYILRFSTPLVCHPDSMLVYPTLREELQEEWDFLQGDLMYGDITQQGYQKKLRRLFIEAGYIVEAETVRREQLKMEQRRKLELGQFDSLMECQTEYRKLRNELTTLQTV